MLDELLDRISKGGLDITVIPISISGNDDVSEPNGRKTIELLDSLNTAETVIRKLSSTMRKNGYEAKADELKSWWMDRTKESSAWMDELTASNPPTREEFINSIRAFNDKMEPVVAELRERAKQITERHINAICEVDLSDLLT